MADDIGSVGSLQDETDIRTMASFIVGWWPGLEDAISWDGTDNPKHPVHDAAKRVRQRRSIR